MKTEKIFITILVTLMLIGRSKGQGNIKLPIDTNNAQNDLKKAYTIELSSLAVDESLYSSEYGTYAHEGADFVKALEEGTITVTPENYFTYDKLSGEIYGYAHDAPYDEIKELVIPSMIDGNIVTGIRYESFVAMDLNKVVFPDTIRKIGNNAFEANNLTELNLPHGIEEIGRSAFQINQLTEIILPNSLTKLDEKAFSSNDIKEVYLGTGLMIGGHKVFDWSKVNVIVNESQLTMKNIGYMLDIDNGADEKQTGIIERGKTTDTGCKKGKLKFMARKIKQETKHIDDCECVYCGHIFDGKDACNGDMDCSTVECPNCEKEMLVMLSIEYVCQPLED